MAFGAVRSYTANAAAWTFGTQDAIGVNDVFAPIAGTHQPYGFDQYAGFYRRYKVVGFRARLEITGASSTGLVVYAARVTPPGVTVDIAADTVDEVMERPGTLSGWANPTTATTPVVLSFNMRLTDIAKICGVTPQQYAADVSEYSAAVGASPSRVPELQLAAASASGSAVMYVLVKLEYDVEFSQRVTQAQS